MRRTKILATLGPACQDPEVLRKMIRAGLSAVRCNFSHGKASDHKKQVELIRQIAREENETIGILGDLQGPKIRVARFKDGQVQLTVGADFVLDASLDKDSGDVTQVSTDYARLAEDVTAGDVLLLDDGNIELVVKSVAGSRINCEVVEGGVLSNNKGINKRGGGLSAPALTAKDQEDIKTAAEIGVDYVAVSFPRDAADVELARQLLQQAGSTAGVVAKIERCEAVDNIDEIIEVSDAVMVARGDLAVEIGVERVPGIQKRIIQRARELDKVAITATQMMESMITNSVPTRAEVSDVANAVLDNTDVVMLSAESAIGKHPVKVISMLDAICRAAESEEQAKVSGHRMELRFDRVDEAIAMAAMYTANHLSVKAIIALTESGATALWMSRIRSSIPIFALTRNPSSMGLMTLYRGVFPLTFDSTLLPKEQVNLQAVNVLVQQQVVEDGDLVLLTSGDHMGEHGGTNKMKVLRVGQVV